MDSGRFVTVNFSGVGSLSARPTLNLEDLGLYFVWHKWVLPEAYAPASTTLQVTEASRPPLLDKVVVVLEEVTAIFLILKTNT
jgi:hypothetical protein